MVTRSSARSSGMQPEAASLWQIDDEFMLGESLLIAPLLEAGQPRRSVYLPAGRWSSFWDEQIYSGPRGSGDRKWA